MDFVFYYYTPSAAAAAIFVVLFGISTLLHSYQLIRTRAWLMIPFLIGGFSKSNTTFPLYHRHLADHLSPLVETIGYIGRLLSSQEAPNFTKNPYIIQSTLLLIAPAFFAASIYMVLGRIIRMIDAEQYSLIRVKWLTKIFVCGDVLSFLMQASG